MGVPEALLRPVVWLLWPIAGQAPAVLVFVDLVALLGGIGGTVWMWRVVRSKGESLRRRARAVAVGCAIFVLVVLFGVQPLPRCDTSLLHVFAIGATGGVAGAVGSWLSDRRPSAPSWRGVQGWLVMTLAAILLLHGYAGYQLIERSCGQLWWPILPSELSP